MFVRMGLIMVDVDTSDMEPDYTPMREPLRTHRREEERREADRLASDDDWVVSTLREYHGVAS